ncbi:hypothetical protein Bca4012_005109 [Brassica carinata]
MNKVGKKNIMEAFEQRFKKNYPDWKPFKNKYDTSRKKYIKIRTLTQNRTGLGFDNMGRIDMSDDWWNEREKDDLSIFSIDLLLTRISVDFEVDRRSIWRFPHRAVDLVSIPWCEAVMKIRREKELLRMTQFEVKGLFEGRIEVIQEAR